MKYTCSQLNMIQHCAEAQSVAYDRVDFDVSGVQWILSHRDGKIALAVRGTDPKEVEDIVANVSFSQINLGPAGRVHWGYYEQAMVIVNWVRRHHPSIDYLCGHSLGGSVAQIVAHHLDLPVVTFGSLRCMDPYAADLFHSTNTCFRFTLRGDKVPYAVFSIKPVKWWGWLPVWFARYKHVGHHIKVGNRKLWNHAHKDYRIEVENWVRARMPIDG